MLGNIFFVLLLFAAPALSAALVVTPREHIEGTLREVSGDAVQFVALDGKERTFLKKDILQVFDDDGKLIWQGALPEVEHIKSAEPLAVNHRFIRHSLWLNFSFGGAASGIYKQENDFVDAQKIYATYADGSTQYAASSMLALGFGVDYAYAYSPQHSNLFSYSYSSLKQSVSLGSNGYPQFSLGNEVLTRIHSVFFGKEFHYYPSAEEATLDLIAQLGYSVGAYYPQATYRDYQAALIPTPPAYTGPDATLLHGPTARVGGGMTIHGGALAFKLAAFYQFSWLFSAYQPWGNLAASFPVQNYYATASVGYGF